MYDPQFRESPQISMPPAQQNLPPYLSSTFQFDATTPESYMVHQGSSSVPAFVDKCDSNVYSHFPCTPVSLTGILNSSHSTQYFVSGQQGPQWTQNLHRIPSHIPPPTSPNGAEMLLLPPPPPLLGQAPSTDLVYPPHPVGMPGAQNTSHPQHPQSSSHIPSVRLLPLPLPPPPPPPPPPPYPLERPPLPPSSPLEPPPLPPPSPSPSSPHASPAASHLLSSSHINRTLSYSLHEGMKHGDLLSRSVQLHNLHEESQYNGSSSRPSQLDSLRNTAVSHLDGDSDVDMEDDITQVDDEHFIPEPQTVPARDSLSQSFLCTESSVFEEQMKEPQTVPVRDSLSQSFLCTESSVFEEQMKESNKVLIFTIPSEVLNETYAAAAEGGKPITSEPVRGSNPFRLIQGYCADTSSESNHKPCLAAVTSLKIC